MSRTGQIDITASTPPVTEAGDVMTAAGNGFVRRRTMRRVLVHEPDADGGLLDFLWARPDDLVTEGELLKDGDRCTVALAEVGGSPFVVKRYNLRDQLHTIRHWLLRSRARWSWLNGRRLRDGGLHSPRPLAYVEERIGACRGRSFLVTEYQPGRTLFDLVHKDGLDGERLTDLARQFAEAWSGLDRMRLGHGDMKATNFIVDASDRLWLVDLDAMRVFPPGPVFRHRRERDLARFMRNWESAPPAAAAFRDALRTAASPAA